MTMYDYIHLCMPMYDYVWLCMIMYDYVWPCMTMYVWSCMTHDYVWLSMTMYDYVSSLALFGPIWPRFTPFGPSWPHLTLSCTVLLKNNDKPIIKDNPEKGRQPRRPTQK